MTYVDRLLSTTGSVHFLTILTFVAASLLESSRRVKAANIWYVAYAACILTVTISRQAFVENGYANGHFALVGLDIRTAMAGLVWPVVLWTIADRFTKFRVAGSCIGWAIAAIAGVVQVRAGTANSMEAFSGFAIGIACSAVFIRYATFESVVQARVGRPRRLN